MPARVSVYLSAVCVACRLGFTQLPVTVWTRGYTLKLSSPLPMTDILYSAFDDGVQDSSIGKYFSNANPNPRYLGMTRSLSL